MWNTVDNHHLARTFTFPDFKSALDFVNRVGAIAEEQGHHPDIHLSWGKVVVETWTHSANAITDKDHKLTAAIDKL
jgi:4a-hydroxytetrahydrobiopterin dehydratase